MLVTGHPNSGTSFLCELVAAMGFSPGDMRCLKPADEHNPHGYWEHVPLQNYIRTLSGYGDWMHVTGRYPLMPLEFSLEERERTALLFRGAGVEIFKETGLPVMYRLFPRDSVYLIITRAEQGMYASQGANYKERNISYEGFCRNVKAYQWLCGCMANEMHCLVIRYEDFQEDLDAQISRIADFVGKIPDLPRLREIWRPRGNHAS